MEEIRAFIRCRQNKWSIEVFLTTSNTEQKNLNAGTKVEIPKLSRALVYSAARTTKRLTWSMMLCMEVLTSWNAAIAVLCFVPSRTSRISSISCTRAAVKVSFSSLVIASQASFSLAAMSGSLAFFFGSPSGIARKQ